MSANFVSSLDKKWAHLFVKNVSIRPVKVVNVSWRLQSFASIIFSETAMLLISSNSPRQRVHDCPEQLLSRPQQNSWWGSNHQLASRSENEFIPSCSPDSGKWHLPYQMWENNAAKFSKSCPKSSHSSFYLQSGVFQNSTKSHQIFGLLLLENLLPSPIWSHWYGVCWLADTNRLSWMFKAAISSI